MSHVNTIQKSQVNSQ
uniref:Uncharacterized protein n=1 Tax=Arundo donax TaxID=35708 RepID=A0A0A9HPZ4_ARUDO